MINQYGAQRSRWSIPPVPVTIKGKTEYRPAPGAKRIGTVPVGTIVYVQDNVRPFRGVQFPVRRNPWIVEAWLNREYAKAGGNTYMRGGHLAQVRSLRDGRVEQVADWIILRSLGDNA